MQNFSISTWTIIRFFMVVLGLGLVYIIRDVLAALLFAIIIASALEPAIEWLKERKIPRIPAVILIYLILVIMVVFLVYLVLPLFTDEFRNLSVSYPMVQQKVIAGVERISAIPLFADLKMNVEGLFNAPANYLDKFSGGIASFASGVFGGLLSFILIVVFSFYLAAQEKGIESFLRMVTPLAYEPYVVHLWGRSQKKLGRWMQSQLLLGAIVGIFIFFGLTFLGVEHALFFAFLSALFEIVPVVGPILAAVPAVVIAFLESPLTGVMVVLLYTVVQQLESHVVIPVVMKRAIGLSPLIVVLALIVGGKVGGIFGMILAVPMVAILAELIEDWDKKKRSILPGS